MSWRQMRDLTGVRYLLDRAREEGLSAELCLAGSAIKPIDLQTDSLFIQAWQEIVVIRNLLRYVGRSGLGFSTGKSYHLTSLGMLGFTMLACSTLREAFEVSQRFQSLALTFCPTHVIREDRGSWLIFDDSVLPVDTKAFIIERTISGYLQLSSELLQRSIEPLIVELTVERPTDPSQYHQDFPFPITFSSQRNALLLATPDLIEPLPQAHPETRRKGERLCEEMCIELSLPLAYSPVARKVQLLFIRESGKRIGCEGVAQRLGVSERTLHRRLAMEGQTLQTLNDGIKQLLAERILKESNMDVESIAKSLGYNDATSFSRAFKRWTGLTPGQWRRKISTVSNWSEQE